MPYLTRMPAIVSWFLPNRIWKIPTEEKTLYLTFDDGPHPTITPLVLDLLKAYNAEATFFCIGKNVQENPQTFLSIVEAGHTIGNHTYSHLNANKVDEEEYLYDVAFTKKYIDSNLFRPPYGRISKFLVKQLQAPAYRLRTVMWSILSADYDAGVSPEKCLANVTLQAAPGDIIVFHDSQKAASNMLYALPRVLKFFSEQGYTFKKLRNEF